MYIYFLHRLAPPSLCPFLQSIGLVNSHARACARTYGYTQPSAITLSADVAARAAHWKSPKGAVVRMLHPAGWGGWAFEVESIGNGGKTMNFSKGGNQEARGNSGCGAYYVEGIAEELDAPGEWVIQGGKLLLIPPAGMTEAELQAATVEAPQLKTLIELRGTAAAPVVGVSFAGFNLTGSAQTFLESYEAPSGGDWSVHRGAAVFLQGAENISFSGMRFDQLEGNGVFFSNHVKHSEVVDCDFWRTGDSAVLAVGSTKLSNATASEYPSLNTIARNWIDTLGVNMKQVSTYSTVRYAVCRRLSRCCAAVLLCCCRPDNALSVGWF